MEDMILTEDMQRAMSLIESGQNVFITGKAGTGKTTFLKYVSGNLNKNYVVAAPTGVAAINAGGTTLHSLFRLPFHPYIPGSTLKRMPAKHNELLKKIQILIIDEVSMVRPDVIDAIDKRLRNANGNQAPFGGVQVIVFGDLFQLPPVVKEEDKKVLQDYYDDYFFFNANVWKNTGFHVVELNKVFRQSDEEFVNILNNIRNYKVTSDELDMLKETKNSELSNNYNNNCVHVCTHKYIVENINQSQLGDNGVRVYESRIDGSFPETSIPCDIQLKVRVGARVMAITNNRDCGYYNGMLGIVEELGDDFIKVKMDNGALISFTQYAWENVEYAVKDGNVITEVVGACVQFPLTLAWAITIHKSQGLTFDNVALHVSRTFCPGQLYVALSRCRSLKGIVSDAYITKRMIIPERALIDFERQYKSEEYYFGQRV